MQYGNYNHCTHIDGIGCYTVNLTSLNLIISYTKLIAKTANRICFSFFLLLEVSKHCCNIAITVKKRTSHQFQRGQLHPAPSHNIVLESTKFTRYEWRI